MLTAAGVLLILTCAVLGSALAARADHKQAYLAAARYVPEGAAVTPSDLETVDISAAPNMVDVPASESAAVVGQRASQPLDAGSLLLPADLTRASPIPADEALVGASLATNQLPAGLVAGDSVIVVLSSSSGIPSTPASDTSPAAGNASPASTVSGKGEGTSGITAGLAHQGALAEATVYSLAVSSADESTGASSSILVTLEVPLAESAEITAASAAGEVSLAEVAPAPVGEKGPAR